jgi:hypothetical protein
MRVVSFAVQLVQLRAGRCSFSGAPESYKIVPIHPRVPSRLLKKRQGVSVNRDETSHKLVTNERQYAKSRQSK